MRLVRPLLLVATVIAAVLLPAGSAAALSYPVTSLAGSGAGSLRQAIEDANGRAGEDTIPIEVAGTIELAVALPIVEDDVAITGPGAGSLAVEPAAATGFRIFSFGDGITASLTGLTIAGGTSRQGGGVRSGNGSLTLIRVVVADNEARAEGGPEAGAEGGGVFSDGALTVRESVIRDNRATAIGGTTSSFALGAGIMAWGSVTVDRSTISGNVAEAHGEGGKHSGALGGGLRVTGEPAIVELSTISGNSVLADNSLTDEARGGGLQGVELTLTSSTVTGNSLFSNGAATGANIEFGGTTLISNTIVADPIGDDASCSTPEGSGGFNLDEDGSCEFGQATDLAGVVAGLEPLAANGGPTPTHALRADSPGLDRGNSFGSDVDQRGLPRPSDFAAISDSEGGDGSDIGAFELQVPAAGGGPVLVSAVPTDTTPPNTRIVSGPARVAFKREAKFRFASTEAQSSFRCKLDDRQWRDCRNPYKGSVKAGKHLFKVRAVDRFGNADPTPARFGWRVKPLS
jgi:large repetitive protein